MFVILQASLKYLKCMTIFLQTRYVYSHIDSLQLWRPRERRVTQPLLIVFVESFGAIEVNWLMSFLSVCWRP